MGKTAEKRAEEKMEYDRLSSLPDGILHHILSFLDMKDVIRTAFLSRTWRNLSTSVSHLNFHAPRVYPPVAVNYYSQKAVAIENFVRFVDQVILFNSAPKIQKFRLRFDHHTNAEYVSHIEEWIRFAMRKGIQELDLRFCHSYLLPSWLLDCETLISLKLENCRFGVSNFAIFPNLTTLSLQSCELREGLVFPNLTTLSLECCKLREGLVFPKLTTLSLQSCELREGLFFPKLTKLSLECCELREGLVLPKLTTLSLQSCKLREGLFFPKLTKLSLECFKLSEGDLVFPKLTTLSLECCELRDGLIFPKLNTLSLQFCELREALIFPNLTALSLQYCELSEALIFPKLNTLSLQFCELRESLIFPKLTTLSLQFCELSEALIFPKLNTLSLECCGMREGSIEDLLKGCPLLENLVLKTCFYCPPIKICSSSSSILRLKRLTMRGDHKNVRVDVEAPNLEILNIYSKKLGNYSFKDMPFLREAYIEVSHPRCSISELHSSLESLLQSLCRVRVLKLSSACIQALSLRALQNLPALIFKHKHLILETGFTIWELKGIAYLMKNSHDIETLVMKLSAQNAYYDLNTTLATKLNFNETEHWESFLSPFSCVELHLKTIEIWDSAGEVYLTLRERSTSDVSETSLGSQGNGIRLLRLCLERAMCLEKLTLYINKLDFKAMQEIAQIIRAFPRASSSAVVLVCKYEV